MPSNNNKFRTKKIRMHGGAPDVFNDIKQRAYDAHAELKKNASDAVQHIKTKAASEEFYNNVNALQKHANNMSDSITNLGSDAANAANTARENMMNSANKSIEHLNAGQILDATKAADETTKHMNKAIDDVSSQIAGQQTVAAAGIGDHAAAMTNKLKDTGNKYRSRVTNLFSRNISAPAPESAPAAGGGKRRKTKKAAYPDYIQRRHAIISSNHKYSKYHNRLLKHKTKRNKKSKRI